jgi:putative ABC transport system permease protein
LVAIINEAFAKEHFPSEDPVWKRIRIYGRLHEVAGIAGDARFDGAGSAMAPAMYVPFRQFPLSTFSVVVRAKSDPPTARAVRAADPNLAVYDATSLERIFASTYAVRRFTLVLASCFAVIALLLAAAGVYALISFTVGRQTREIGIRMALGAPRAKVFTGTVQSAVIRVVVGLALGMAAAVAAGRGIQSMLYEVSPWDPMTYAGVSVLLLLVAVVAAWVPAIRASRIDPMIALRYE